MFNIQRVKNTFSTVQKSLQNFSHIVEVGIYNIGNAILANEDKILIVIRDSCRFTCCNIKLKFLLRAQNLCIASIAGQQDEKEIFII